MPGPLDFAEIVDQAGAPGFEFLQPSATPHQWSIAEALERFSQNSTRL